MGKMINACRFLVGNVKTLDCVADLDIDGRVTLMDLEGTGP
jgi:hypothetical protein